MKKLKHINIIIILISSIVLFSCEKVIDIDLNEADRRLVIEGNVTSESEPYSVILSTSGGYFDNTAIQPVENGSVQISDEDGNITILEQTSPGIYSTDEFIGVENRNYSVQVEVNGEIYSGSDYLPPKIAIDSLFAEIDDFGGPGQEEEEKQMNKVSCTFTDPVDTLNYYRFMTFVNGERIDGDFSVYRVTDDEFFDGNTITLGIRGVPADPGDTVRLELQSIGANTYTYFNQLNDAIYGGGGPGSTPYNPETNLDNGALGYFGAYSIVSDSLIIQE